VITDSMKQGIVQLRTFVPARDFALSSAFYEAVGFEPHPIGPKLTHLQLGRFAFMLQDYYLQAFAENLMMHLLVEDIDAWWRHLGALGLGERFGVREPQEPKLEPWGLRVSYLFDPAGVLWHVAAEQVEQAG
jgi:Glyoxalase/Bleomycin resistance protein/Dioxygenase superfamily